MDSDPDELTETSPAMRYGSELPVPRSWGAQCCPACSPLTLTMWSVAPKKAFPPAEAMLAFELSLKGTDASVIEFDSKVIDALSAEIAVGQPEIVFEEIKGRPA